jgi:hypothetical protein
MNKMLVALSLTAGIACAVPALADGIAQPIDIKVGGFFPESVGYRAVSGDTFTSVGGDIALKQAPTNPEDTLGLYFDYAQSQSHSHSSVYGGGIQVKSEMFRNGKATYSDPYFGFGAGYYQTSFRDNFSNSSLDNDHSADGFGAKAFVGIGVAQDVFVEASYQYVPSHGAGDASGLGAQVGIRF